MAWTVVEQFIEGKSDEIICEDLIVVTDHFAAVIDGASDATKTTFGGQSGGRFAAEAVAQAITGMAPDVTGREFADQLSGALAQAVEGSVGELDPSTRWPAACVVCVSFASDEIWSIGDCSFTVDGQQHVGNKRVDEAAYTFRAAFNSAMLASGTSLDEIRRDDPGAVAARQLINIQQHLSNTPGPWGYGCLNGRPVPDEFVEIVRLDDGAAEIVLTTDGFPDPQPSLVESEERLRHLLEIDPAAIDQLWAAGKSLKPGANSFDDRAYLRLVRAEPE